MFPPFHRRPLDPPSPTSGPTRSRPARQSPRVFVLGVLAALLAVVPAASEPLVLVLDASGSMWGRVEGRSKIEIAREVLAGLVDELPAERELGLVAYGHRREGDCADIEVLRPVGPVDPAATRSLVDGLNPRGKTPLTASVETALGLLGGDEPAAVVLLTDGLETCGGDPCRTVRLAREAGTRFVFHVVGFDVGDEDVASLECAAQAGGGLYLPAADAEQLAAALAATAAAPVEEPTGALVVGATADGELQDVGVDVRRVDAEARPVVARTYASSETNPRRIPLDDGTWEVAVEALGGLRGDVERRFEIEIVDGSVVEKRFDFSSGEIRVGVTRNGSPSDAVATVVVAASGREVDKTRTYTAPTSNPAAFRLTPGTYRVTIGSVEISGKPEHTFEDVGLGAGAVVDLAHDFASGDLAVGAVNGADLVDAVVRISGPDGQVAQGRTYTSPTSNPKRFTLSPGTYSVGLKALGVDGKPERTVQVQVVAGGQATETVDFGG